MRKAIAIGTSAGGINALDFLLPYIPSGVQHSFFVVQHISPDSDSFFIQMLNAKCQVKIKEACDTEEILPGVVYFAPPGYHLLVEDDYTFSLDVDEKVNFARPSIDVLFEAAAEVYGKNLTGILLTGANADGGSGLKTIYDAGGFTIVQDPNEAKFRDMPEAALNLFKPHLVLCLDEIARYMERLFC
jgi:Chemotaxis response regulator containing a CheY-like receiver domain and a methylesterase domain